MEGHKFEWKKMPFAYKAASTLSRVLSIGIAIIAFRDIRHRSPGEIKGNRRIWMLSLFSMTGIYGFSIPIAPLAYLLFARKK